MTCLTDSMLSSKSSKTSKTLRAAVPEGSAPHALREKMLKTLKGVKFVSLKKVNPPSRSGWLATIKAIQMLWENFKTLVTALETKNVNRDPLENLLVQVRFSSFKHAPHSATICRQL
jgi:hypothetical protein